MPPITFIDSPSPNFGPRGEYKPEIIVIHCTDGIFPTDLEWLRNTISQVSSHYLIAPLGDVHRLVKEDFAAWGNGRVEQPTAKLLKKTLFGKYINPNLYTISIEVSMRATATPRNIQWDMLKALVKDIATRHNIPIDRDHIIGHREIYALKTCPGTIDVNKLVQEIPTAVDKEKIKSDIKKLVDLL